MKTAREILIDIYLDYWNNYLTIAKYAEHNGIEEIQARTLLTLAREIYNTRHPEE